MMFAAWVTEQNNLIFKVEIGNEARHPERPTEVINGEINKNYNSREVSNNNKTCSIFQFGEHKPMQCHKFCRATAAAQTGDFHKSS
jgi:hypothetical protein